MSNYKLNPNFLPNQILSTAGIDKDGNMVKINVVLIRYLAEPEEMDGPHGKITLDCIIQTGPNKHVKASSAQLTPW